MIIITDNNVLFSIMNPKSISSYLFSYINADFIAPEFIKSEFDKYKELCVRKSGLSEQEFEMRQDEINSMINFVEESEYENFLLEAVKNLLDPKDSPYLALALAKNALIWTNDSDLKKQSLVKVFSTSELIDKIIKGNM